MFALVGAGGATVDPTLYPCKEAPLEVILEGVCEGECIQAGPVFVDRVMQKRTKYFLQFGSTMDTRLESGIFRGQLKPRKFQIERPFPLP